MIQLNFLMIYNQKLNLSNYVDFLIHIHFLKHFNEFLKILQNPQPSQVIKLYQLINLIKLYLNLRFFYLIRNLNFIQKIKELVLLHILNDFNNYPIHFKQIRKFYLEDQIFLIINVINIQVNLILKIQLYNLVLNKMSHINTYLKNPYEPFNFRKILIFQNLRLLQVN